jgi:hypothetical protein
VALLRECGVSKVNDDCRGEHHYKDDSKGSNQGLKAVDPEVGGPSNPNSGGNKEEYRHRAVCQLIREHHSEKARGSEHRYA